MARTCLVQSTAQDTAKAVLIAGPTASGKSSLALQIAFDQGRAVINADAIQVYSNWHILTARPSSEDEAQAPHLLYGHISGDTEYSVGAWLREVTPLLAQRPAPVIVGGTGLYFTALTEGLADIPATPPELREKATEILKQEGIGALLRDLDAETLSRIDQANPMRVQRAWEVLQATGRALAQWQDDTPPPLLPLADCHPIVLDAPKEWLSPRIAQRCAWMMENGAIEEARQNLADWNPVAPSSKAIGAAEMIAFINGELALDDAQEAIALATRQFAKRQRSWFRARMQSWDWVTAEDL